TKERSAAPARPQKGHWRIILWGARRGEDVFLRPSVRTFRGLRSTVCLIARAAWEGALCLPQLRHSVLKTMGVPGVSTQCNDCL
ncbi:hypothetical protein JOQ06_022151, partial [Pogonophryne albipinna]